MAMCVDSGASFVEHMWRPGSIAPSAPCILLGSATGIMFLTRWGQGMCNDVSRFVKCFFSVKKRAFSTELLPINGSFTKTLNAKNFDRIFCAKAFCIYNKQFQEI